MNRRLAQLYAPVLLVLMTSVQADEGVYILPYGQVMSQSGKIISEGNTTSGASGDRVVGSDGKVYSAKDLRVDNRGKLITRSGKAFKAQKRAPTGQYNSSTLRGSSVAEATANSRTRGALIGKKSGGGSGAASGSSSSSGSARAGAAGNAQSESETQQPPRQYAGPGVELVIGGSSEDGVARVGKLPILP